MEPLLIHAEELIQQFLPPPLQEKLALVDTWGVETAGIQHAGTLLSLVILLIALFLSLSIISGVASTLGGGRIKGRGRKGKRGKANTILLLGPCGGGKTTLFHKILYNEIPETVTSMKESVVSTTSTIEDGEKAGAVISYRLVDFPGHERLRMDWIKYLNEGRVAGIVYVVDATEISTTTVRGTAEFLFDILTDAGMEEGSPLLIACNKSDVTNAKTPNRVKSLLIQELDRLRKTRGASSHLENDENRVPLGRAGEPLNLDVDAPSEVSFASVSSKDVSPLVSFITKALLGR